MYLIYFIIFFFKKKDLFKYINSYKKKSTTAGFEPTLPMENSLAGSRLNHSAKLSFSLLYFIIIIIFLFIFLYLFMLLKSYLI